jgi:tetratricopeptide (TPR) repeat protein
MFGLAVAGAAGCSSSRKTVAPQTRRIPPGLDSTTVARAVKMADSNFVATSREQTAAKLAQEGKEKLGQFDQFWAVLESENKNRGAMPAADQASFEREFNQGAASLSQWKKLSQNGADAKAGREALSYCLESQAHLEEALRLNPFDKNTRILLALVYYNLQHIFGQDKNHDKAIRILERLTRLEKGEHNLYRLLGENYLALKQHDAALANFRKAQEVMLKTGFMAPPDTAMLYYYAYVQGDIYARTYDAENARLAFKEAERFARTAPEKTDIKNYLKWINWDGGNLRASELWDKVLEVEAAKDYPKTAMACSNLLPLLKTKNAKLEAMHKLGIIEFEFLGKKEQAVERMRLVFENIPMQTNGMPQDSSRQVFLDSYGAMLFRLGIAAKDRGQKKLGLAYQTKATSFRWNQEARACREMMTLAWNTPETAITFGKRALAHSAGLSAGEICELNSLVSRACKSAGRFDEARIYFEQWKQCDGKFTANEAPAKKR